MKTKPLCFSQNNHSRLYILLCALALLLGGMIYILFRASEPVFFHWIRFAGFDSWFNFARSKCLFLRLVLPKWIVYSLPDGLWAFAYALLITGIWKGSKSRLKYFWIASIPLLVIGFEILQYTEIIPGTFCMQDIALGMAGMTTGILTGIFTIKPKNHESAFE
jgi:hypothetical protein